MQYRAATEATRNGARRAEAWQKNAPAGEDPHQGEKNPAGSVAPGGNELNYLSRALRTAQKKISE